MTDQNDAPVRLSKLMSERGLCSRREADKLISEGKVLVDGKIIDILGTKVPPNCKIVLSRSAKDELAGKLTVMIYKPVGYVSGQAEEDYIPAVRLLKRESCLNPPKIWPLNKAEDFKSLAPAGRLDIDSKGLLILTQDGQVAKKIISPETKIDKEYVVFFEGELTDQVLRKLRFGLILDGKKLQRAIVSEIEPQTVKVVLTEGKKRQIRRMFDIVGLKVLSLKRVRVGKLTLGNLAEGEWVFVNGSDI